MRPIRIVAADDSGLMRGLLTRMFAAERAGAQAPMELCATVPDGASCLHAVRTLQPDVVLMDVHMPGLGGMEAVLRLRREWPRLPIIMCSAATEDGAAATLEALARGASDYVTKPAGQSDAETAMTALWAQLAPRIVALAKAPESCAGGGRAGPARGGSAATGAGSRVGTGRRKIEVVGIGVSTGGPTALERLLPGLPEDFPVPVLVVQHMPKLFTSALAERLDRCCALRVRLATAGTMLQPGTIWVAPGDSHMEVKAGAQGMPHLALNRGEPLHHCRPAVDVLFRSLAGMFGAGALGLVLTGMGADGVEGSRAIAEAGGIVLAQDEASSAVWGMPGRVVAAGLALAVLPLGGLGEELIALTMPGEGHAGKQVRSEAQQMEARHGLY